MESCSTCRFMLRSPETLDTEDVAECHRESPVVVVVGDKIESVFPSTVPDSWCGEYEVSHSSSKAPSHAAVHALGKKNPKPPKSNEAVTVTFDVGKVTEQEQGPQGPKPPKGQQT